MGHLVAKVGLAPLLVFQGKTVSQNIIRLPEPAGERQGVTGAGPRLRLLVLGDSAAAGVGVGVQREALLGNTVSRLAPHFEVHWQLIAKTGATTASTLRKLGKVKEETFDVVLTSLGVNDVTANKSRRVFLQEQKALVELLRAKFGAPHIILSGFPPVGKFPALPQPLRWYLGLQSERFDRGLEALASAQGCDYLRLNDLSNDPALMASDGFHPGAEVYRLWAQKAAACVLTNV